MNLRLAASEGHTDVVKTFLSTVPSCSLPNSHTAFYAAAARGHVEVVRLDRRGAAVRREAAQLVHPREYFGHRAVQHARHFGVEAHVVIERPRERRRFAAPER